MVCNSNQILKKISIKIILVVITFIIFCCNSKENRDTLNSSLIDIYHGSKIYCEYNSKTFIFNLPTYGFAKLILYNDSTYNFNLEILKDVIYEDKELNIHKVLLNAGFKRFNAGKFSIFNSKINFQDYEGNDILRADYNFNLDTLRIYFLDAHQKNWNLVFIKNRGE